MLSLLQTMGLYRFDTSKIPHVVDNRLTDDGYCQNYAPASLYPPQEDICYILSRNQGHNDPRRIR